MSRTPRTRAVRPPRARAAARRVTLAAAALLVCAGAAQAADALAPCRDLARTPAAARLLALARAAMESYWSGAPVDTAGVPDWPGEPGALYVSLARGRATRACVGSAVPPRGPLAECVRALALDALRADPRRPPVRREELAGLRVVIAFAGEAREVADPLSVDPGREGLLVGSARGHVAFLPGEARTVSWALREARRSGLLEGPLDCYRFPAVVIAEPEPPARGETHDE